MSDLIKRSDAIRALHKHFSKSGFDADRWWNSTIVLFALNSVPSADRPQGEWTYNVFRPDIHRYECSNCKAHHMAIYDYCPSCGAKMKGSDDDLGRSKDE